MIRLYLVRDNTFYAITSKRVIFRSGFWGTDFRTLDHDQVKDIRVSINPVESCYGVGTLTISTGETSNQEEQQNNFFCQLSRTLAAFVGIQKPYETMKLLKQVSFDVKTDVSYPNALRTDTNPGYKTRYVIDRKAL